MLPFETFRLCILFERIRFLGSPDEDSAGGTSSGNNGGRSFAQEAGPTAPSQSQRQQQFSGQRGGGLKRSAGVAHLTNHRGRPVAVNVPRKISRI